MSPSGHALRPAPEELSAFVDGELSAGRAGEIRAHLAECARCRASEEALAAIRAAVARVPRAAVPETLVRRVEALVRNGASGPPAGRDGAGGDRRRRWRSAQVLALAGAAVAVLAAFVAWWPWLGAREPRPDGAVLLAALVDDHARVESGSMPPTFPASTPEALRPALRAGGVNEPLLAITGAELLGGRLCSLAGERALLAQWVLPEGKRLSVFTFGRPAVAAALAEALGPGGCDTHGAYTVCAWQVDDHPIAAVAAAPVAVLRAHGVSPGP